jgi:peroxiredoxin
VPEIALISTGGVEVSLREQSEQGMVVVFAYPRTGQPGVEPPLGWDSIPGARGCTPEACSFRDLTDNFAACETTGFGLSAQDTEYQSEAAARLRLPYDLLSDENLRLAEALRLPVFEVEGMTLLKRITLLLADGRVTGVIYPVFPPDEAAFQALALVQRSAHASQQTE